jgi:hypothetical protein
MATQDVKIVNDQILHAIRWSGNDLELTFTDNNQGLSRGVVIRVRDATGVFVKMEFGTQSGMGLIWDATTITDLNGVTLSVDFAGAPSGSIKVSGTRLDIVPVGE